MITTENPTRRSSSIITLFSASQTSSPSSSSILPPSSVEQQKATKEARLSPPLYLNEIDMEKMTTAEALAVFLHQPVLATPREFIQVVARMKDDAWSGDGRSRSYVIVDEVHTGLQRQQQKGSKRRNAAKDEDYELPEWKYSSAEDQCPVPASYGNQPLTQTALANGNQWNKGVTGQNMSRLLTPGGII